MDKEGTYYSRSVAASDIIAVNPDFVRITEFESLWEMKPIDDRNVHIEYRAKANPGGFIPTWLVNLVITKGPLETITKFTQMVESDQVAIH